MIHQLNKNLHSEKSDYAPSNSISSKVGSRETALHTVILIISSEVPLITLQLPLVIMQK